MNKTVWREFPEINRKVAFSTNYSGDGIRSGIGSLGCHVGTISGVTATFGTSYNAAESGKNVLVLDETKEKQITFTKDRYDEFFMAPKEEVKLVIDYLTKINYNSTAFEDDIFASVVKLCKSYPLWVMSDVINYEAPARKSKDANFVRMASTGDFAKYLIRNKIGFVMGSPIVQNPQHRMNGTYSLNQGWFWIPPDHINRSLDCSAYYGTDKFPSKKEWLDTVKADLVKNESTEEAMTKLLFNNGAFPEEVRFQRSEAIKEA